MTAPFHSSRMDAAYWADPAPLECPIIGSLTGRGARMLELLGRTAGTRTVCGQQTKARRRSQMAS